MTTYPLCKAMLHEQFIDEDSLIFFLFVKSDESTSITGISCHACLQQTSQDLLLEKDTGLSSPLVSCQIKS